MGEDPSNLTVPFLLNDQIWNFINDLECELSNSDFTQNSLLLIPNPVLDSFTLKAPKELTKINIYTAQSQYLDSFKASGLEVQINIASFATGLYYVKVYFADGKSIMRKIIKK